MRMLTTLILVAAATTILAPYAYLGAVPEAVSLRQALDLSDCSNCGIEKLTDDELSSLVSLISSRRGRSYLEESALQYLRKQGWFETEIIGYEKRPVGVTSMTEIWMLAMREGRLFGVRSGAIDKPLPTGLYWSKGGAYSWEVLDTDGITGHYSIDELE